MEITSFFHQPDNNKKIVIKVLLPWNIGNLQIVQARVLSKWLAVLNFNLNITNGTFLLFFYHLRCKFTFIYIIEDQFDNSHSLILSVLYFIIWASLTFFMGSVRIITAQYFFVQVNCFSLITQTCFSCTYTENWRLTHL